MSTTRNTTTSADLQALADEIAADTGVSPAEALILASQQRPGLRLFAARWNATARRSRSATVPQGQRPRRVTPEGRLPEQE